MHHDDEHTRCWDTLDDTIRLLYVLTGTVAFGGRRVAERDR